MVRQLQSAAAASFLQLKMALSKKAFAEAKTKEKFYRKERLIQEVQTRPALWDKSRRDHRVREVLNAQWQEVADAMGSTSTEVRVTWKSLLDYFCNVHYTATHMRNEVKWAHYESMIFMRDQVEMRNRTSRGNGVSDDSNDMLYVEINPGSQMNETQPASPPSIDPTTQQLYMPADPHSSAEPASITPDLIVTKSEVPPNDACDEDSTDASVAPEPTPKPQTDTTSAAPGMGKTRRPSRRKMEATDVIDEELQSVAKKLKIVESELEENSRHLEDKYRGFCNYMAGLLRDDVPEELKHKCIQDLMTVIHAYVAGKRPNIHVPD